MSDFSYKPVDNSNIALRPLTRGMVRNIAPQMLPKGSMYDVQNMYVSENGPKRRGGFKPSGGGAVLDESVNGTIWDLISFQNGDTLEVLAITDQTVKKFNFNEGFSDITLNAEITGNPFNGNKIYNIDHTVVPRSNGYSVLFTDGNNYIREYTGLELKNFNTEYSNPLSIEFFDNRLWVGSPDSSHPNRLIWSNLDVSYTFDVSNYLDFLEEQDEIIGIKGLGNLLVVYFPKAVYFGRPTNRVDLPYSFTKLETGRIGLPGKKAVVSWDDGHFFVGLDDVYYFSASSSLEPIGTPVIQEMIKNCDFKEGIYAAIDPLNDSVIFGVPEEGPDITSLWYFNYKTKGWSRSDVTCSMIASAGTFNIREWDDGDDTMEIDGISIDDWDSFETQGFGSWKSLESSLSVDDLFIAMDNVIYQNDDLINVDFGSASNPIPILLESGDLDLDIPDQTKCFNRLSLKIQEPTDNPIRFQLWTSNNRGRSWEEKGEFIIETDTDEGRINFRSYGSTFRFRITSISNVSQYTINEIILRGRPRGLQT